MRNKLNGKMLLPTIIATLHDNLHQTREHVHAFLLGMAVMTSKATGNQIIKAGKYA